MADAWFEAGYANSSATLQLHIYTVEKNINENWTKERADLWMRVNANWGYYNNYGTQAYIGINGNNTTQTVNFDARVAAGTQLLLIGTWDTIVWHNNNGDASIGVSCSHATGVGLGTASGVWTYNCDHIPRYAKFTQHYVKSKTLNTVTMYWSADVAVSAWQHSINGGAWQDCNGGNTYVISNLAPNTTYNIRTRIKRSDSGLWTESGTVSAKTFDIARINAVPDITIGQNAEITYTNPGEVEDIEIALLQTDGTTIIRNYVPVTGGTHTFEFTEQEINKIYSLTTSSLFTNLRFYIKTTQNSQTYVTYTEAKFNVDAEQNLPEFNEFTFIEKNNAVFYLTGGAPNLVKNKSIAEIIIFESEKAIAKNGASILRYEVTNGNITETIPYSSSADVSTIINNVPTNTFVVKAIDSRGLFKSVTVVGNMFDYQRPYISDLLFNRENGIGDKAFFTITGKFDNIQYPNQSNPTKVSFRYKKRTDSETEYSEWIDITDFDGLILNSETGVLEENESDDKNFLPGLSGGTKYSEIVTKYEDFERAIIYDDFRGSSFDPNEYAEFEMGIVYDIEFKVSDLLDEWIRPGTLSSGIPCRSQMLNNDGYYSTGINCFPDENYANKVVGNSNLDGTDMNKFFIRNDGARINENREDGNSQIFSNCFAFEPTEESYGILFVSLGALNPSTTTKFKIKGFLTANDIDTEFEISFYASSSNIRNAKCKIENQEWLKSIYVCNSDDGLVLAFVNEYDGTSSYSTWNNTALFIEKIYTSFNELDLSQIAKDNWQCLFLNGFYLTTNNVECSKFGYTNIVTGKEVATNEYVDKKRVFVKRIDCGALPNATSKNVELGIDFTALTLIRIEGSTKNSAGNLNYPLPFAWSNIAEQVGILINRTKLTISTSIDKSSFTQTYIDLYYTKN